MKTIPPIARFVLWTGLVFTLNSGNCFGKPFQSPFQNEVTGAKTAITAGPKAKVQKIVFLSEENTQIQFIGKHVGKKPRPRTGGFEKFSGRFVLDRESNRPISLNITINISSIKTKYSSLTSHLLGKEFFDSIQFPKANFQSSKITQVSNSKILIHGFLSLHGVKKEILIPAKYSVEGNQFSLQSKFSISRSQFGINQMGGGVADLVDVSVNVGKATKNQKEQAGNGSNPKDSTEKLVLPKNMSQRKVVNVLLPNML